MLGGGLFDAEPLFVPGASFVLLAVVSQAWVRVSARGAGVRRTLSPLRVQEDEPVTLTLHATSGITPFPGGTIEEPLLSGSASPLLSGRSADIRIQARFARRGRRRLVPPVLVIRDPLGLSERRVSGSETVDLLVLPRTSPVDVVADGTPRSAGHARAMVAGSAEVELDGLRSYRPGAPASRIHWPALARGAGLLERHLRPEGDGRPLIVLDPRAPQRPEDLDAAVRAAASLCLALARAGGCVIMLPGDRRAVGLDAGLGTWPALHARLALVEATQPVPPFAAAAARAGTVYYVAARTGDRPARVLERIGGPRVLVVPGDLSGRRAAFAVSGCRGYAMAPARRPTADAA